MEQRKSPCLLHKRPKGADIMSRKRTTGFAVVGLAILGFLLLLVGEAGDWLIRTTNEIGDRCFAQKGDGPGFEESEDEDSELAVA